MSKISRKSKERHFKAIGDQHKFLSRITKTLYYGKLPTSDRLSLPVTEYASELFSEAQSGRSLERLHCNDAASISRRACVSPCSFILAMLYLERLKTRNPDYLLQITPSELFLVSLMVSSKFLYDDGEEDEVFIDEWAISGGISMKDLAQLEKDFLNAIVSDEIDVFYRFYDDSGPLLEEKEPKKACCSITFLKKNWEIFVNESTFWKKLKQLESIIAKKAGTTRGWFTYTELESLLVNVDIHAVTQYLMALTAVLIVTYAVGILTIISSVFVVSHLPGNCLQLVKNETLQEDVINLPAPEDSKYPADELNLLQTEGFKCTPKKQMDAADVLKTGLILASIKSTDLNCDCNKSCVEPPENLDDFDNKQAVSWDWWSSPTMEWLTRISKMIQKFDFVPEFKYYTSTDSAVANSRIVDLEDQVHKATKIRIQDQLERSWHEEWTDTIKEGLFVLKPFTYLRGIKT